MIKRVAVWVVVAGGGFTLQASIFTLWALVGVDFYLAGACGRVLGRPITLRASVFTLRVFADVGFYLAGIEGIFQGDPIAVLFAH